MITNNILPLETFREILGYHPYHFYGMSNSSVPVTSNCNALVNQHAYQGTDAVGREEIRRAIVRAESMLFDYLGYHVGKVYKSKLLQYPRPYDNRMEYTQSIGGDGRWLSINAGEGYIQEIGIEAFTELESGANVTLSDSYGDGITDTFTLTVNLTGQDPQPTAAEIAVYFRSADIPTTETNLQEKWRVKPLEVSISGVTLTITGRSWLIANPTNYQGFNRSAIDPDDATALVGKLDVYRRYTKRDGITTDDSQAVLVWETSPPYWALDCSGTGLSYGTENAYDPAAVAYAIGRAGIRNGRLGEIAPAQVTYDSDTGEFVARSWASCRQPDRVILRYLAGADADEVNSQYKFSGSWDQVVARLAMAELGRPICACDYANRELFHWQYDLSQTSGNNDIAFQAVSPEQLNNPFGTRRGHLYAWQRVRYLKTTISSII